VPIIWNPSSLLERRSHHSQYHEPDESLGDKTVFVSDDLSIRYALGPVYPSTYDKFPPRRKGNQIPSLVLEEGVVLLLHGRFPKGISSRLSIRLWI
jgi:hypothetical protein